MFSHIFIGISDFERALAFYQPLMNALGIQQRFVEPGRPWGPAGSLRRGHGHCW
jgi:hypothetical protein